MPAKKRKRALVPIVSSANSRKGGGDNDNKTTQPSGSPSSGKAPAKRKRAADYPAAAAAGAQRKPTPGGTKQQPHQKEKEKEKKRRRKVDEGEGKGEGEDVVHDTGLPFSVVGSDHCETPLVAYRHIARVLSAVATGLGKRPEDLLIYDPFYCAGAMVQNLAECGFPRVYNRPEDFYAVQRDRKVPDFDVLVTNPPYSADHVERLFAFCRSTSKPYFLLLPNYVVTKPWHPEFKEGAFYVVPSKRYTYCSPKGRRDHSHKKGAHKTAPFTSFWYCHLASMEERAALFEGDNKLDAVPEGASLVQGVRHLKRLGVVGSPWEQYNRMRAGGH